MPIKKKKTIRPPNVFKIYYYSPNVRFRRGVVSLESPARQHVEVVQKLRPDVFQRAIEAKTRRDKWFKPYADP